MYNQTETNKAQIASNTTLLSMTANAVYTLQTTQKAAFLDNHILDARPFLTYALSGNYPNKLESTNDVAILDGLWRRIGFIFKQKNNYSGYGRNAISTRFKPPSAGYYLVIFSLQTDIDASDTTARTLNFRMFRQGVGNEFEFKRTLLNDTGIKAYYNINHTQIVQLNNSGEYCFDVMSDGADHNNLSSATSEIIVMRINSNVGSAVPIYP